MFGVTSHYIGDMNWHGLAQSPSGYGFIQTLGMQNFGCNGNLCQVAHSSADTRSVCFNSCVNFFALCYFLCFVHE